MKTEGIDVTLPDNRIKAGTVKNMFGRIAARYDVMNRLMTFGRDQAWHREVVRRAALPVGGRLLDIGSGTGGIVCAALERDATLSAVAADFTFAMMATGRVQHANRPIQWCGADALRLPFQDNTFDAVTSGYLIRNVTDIRQAFEEQVRVLRPGGKIVCLDTSPPPTGILQPFINAHLQIVIPLAGRLISGDAHAYRYLPESTQHFEPPEKLRHRMQAAGLEKVAFQRLMFGTVVILHGTKPGTTAA
jgi:demethylmenaquinone methyltransferase / 2-methoxy-6-polyprenyl-1,4-benzoquinol methylase